MDKKIYRMPGIEETPYGPITHKKTKMLFLDDRSKRLHSALEKFSDEFEVILVCNVRECLRYLARFDFAVVSLDHDLHGMDFEDPDSEIDGMEIVRYLEKTGWPKNKPKPTFHVHSSNIFAAHLMVTRLLAMGFFAEWKRFEYPKNMHANYI